MNSVTNDPVPDVEVTLTCVKLNQFRGSCSDVYRRPTPPVKSAADGTFQFSGFFAGVYAVAAGSARGLVVTRLSHAELEMDHQRAPPGLVLKLEPESTLSGKVLDEEGKPKPKKEVVALRQIPSGSVTQLKLIARAITDDDGGYVFRRLVPGNYYVVTQILKPNAGEFFLYAPSATSLEEAVATHVEAGQHLSDIDLRLRPLITYRIQGRAQMETPGQLISGKLELHLYSRDSSGVIAPEKEIQLSPDGRFQSDVLQGSYTLRLTGTTTVNPPPGTKAQPVMMPHLLAKQDIEVIGKDQYGLIVLIPPPFLINAHIYMEGGDSKPLKGNVSLRPVDLVGAGGCQTFPNQTDDGLVITNCDAANYAVRYSPPDGSYVKAITFNEDDAMRHPIDVSRSSGGELKILIHAGAASVTATVQDDAHKTYEVVLIPDTWAENEMIPVIRAKGDKDGKYTATGLAPGHYAAIAGTNVDSQFWQNAAFVRELRSRGTPFDLGEGEQKQLVITQLVEDELTQIELRLGLY